MGHFYIHPSTFRVRDVPLHLNAMDWMFSIKPVMFSLGLFPDIKKANCHLPGYNVEHLTAPFLYKAAANIVKLARLPRSILDLPLFRPYYGVF